MALDPLECFLYAGATDGTLYRVQLIQTVRPLAASACERAQVAHARRQDLARGLPDAPGAVVPLGAHGGAILSVAVSPDGAAVISGAEDGTARVWDAASGQVMREVQHAGAVTNVLLVARPHAHLRDQARPDGFYPPVAIFHRSQAPEPGKDVVVHVSATPSPVLDEDAEAAAHAARIAAADFAPGDTAAAAMHGRIEQLEADVAVLQALNARWRGVADDLMRVTATDTAAVLARTMGADAR